MTLLKAYNSLILIYIFLKKKIANQISKVFNIELIDLYPCIMPLLKGALFNIINNNNKEI